MIVNFIRGWKSSKCVSPNRLCKNSKTKQGLGMYFCSLVIRVSSYAGLEEAQTGIKIAGRNINNLRYADDTTLMAESEELKSLLMKVKEESEKLA